jgi:zinc transport system ATP-binding protein
LPTDAASLITLQGVDVALGGERILHGIDLNVDQGEVVTLIGPNGAGKTTLVRAVLGLVTPSAGRLRRRPGTTFGYVPQRFHIDPTLPLTVRRFLALPHRRSRAAIERALAEVDAGYTIDRAVQALSGGEFQKVMLARALMRRPDVLVLDEPLQGVDVGGQIALSKLIGELRRAHGFAVLMVSHDLHLVMQATDRVVCLNRHVCCHGQPEAVSRHPEYQALFGPQAGEALAIYRHGSDTPHAAETGDNVVPLASDSGAVGEDAGRTDDSSPARKTGSDRS